MAGSCYGVTHLTPQDCTAKFYLRSPFDGTTKLLARILAKETEMKNWLTLFIAVLSMAWMANCIA